MLTLMTLNDTIENSYSEKYNNQFLILKPEALSPEYRSAKYQLFYATGGFGCDPSKMGTAVFGSFCADGDCARMERYHFLGIAKPEAVKEWTEMYGRPVSKAV